jgi:shikimate 5-dehydrogenase
MRTFEPARAPTLYFIGVTTGKSSIMKVFPGWAKALGLRDAVITGMDFPLHDDPAAYRAAVDFIRNDPLSRGALITTHKIDLYAACRDMFGVVDPHAALMSETSCLSKRDGALVCHAKDPISSGLALDAFLPDNHFASTGAEVFSMGCGGSTIALTWHLMRPERGADRPTRIVVSDRNQARLDEIRHVHERVGAGIPVRYVLCEDATANDAVLASLPPGSVAINASGLGKDRPGSPLTDAAVFPENGIVWDLNYRGELVFLDQARRQAAARRLQVENGWIYFIHGWTQVIAEVFAMAIPSAGPAFEALSRIAAEAS